MLTTTTAHNGTLARAAEATTRLKEEIDQLWFDAMTSNDVVGSERLLAVSHAIRRVFHLLDQERAIG
jgi:hypothetical protein